ncbi:MAG: glycerophosphodiester phosphodiesterase family protein [Pseudomonadota bacterium]
MTKPIAHRALHSLAEGAPENSLPAVTRAVHHGYGIEIDLQPSADGVAMVFHDATLDRMTAERGPFRARNADSLRDIQLADCPTHIPTLTEVLAAVSGAVPILLEIKDQSGCLTGSDGVLETATIEALTGYDGPVAVMSFNPDMIAKIAELAPDIPRGLVTAEFEPPYWSFVPRARAAHLRQFPDLERVGACFLSHDVQALANPDLAALRARGLPILTWTIRNAAQEAMARPLVDNITFEGYVPQMAP